MSRDSPPLAPWWRPRWVRHVLADLLRDELRRLRPGAVPAVSSPVVSPDAPDASAAPDTSDAPDTGDPLAALALDSIELLDLATAVSLRFGLHHHDLDRRLLAEPRLEAWAETVIAGRCRDDARIAFFTSGSTGRPRRCAHEMAALVQEVTHWAGQVGTPRRVLRAVPCHHIYGFLFTVMLPAQLGIDVIDVRGALPAGVLARTEPGDLLVGHPGFFALAAADAGAATDVLAVTSTGQCPDFVWAALADAGVSRVLEVYGSSECAGIGSRLTAAAPFTLLPWWIPEPGRARLLRTLGEPCIAQDRWEWVDRRRFRVHGRLDGAVQVAGENVFPGRVRDVLLTHPAVADAAVRPFGEDVAVRLKAFVVPADPDADPPALRRALDHWLAARLRPAERPRRIDVGPSLPQTPAGKPADW